ncbi:mitochondrial carrier [Neoconidiobolus thromboides FSU 785]|nr:mitochondrial carrier [Neoconidiobolus thromboides FSU 785]
MSTLKESSIISAIGGYAQDTTIDNIERYKRVFYKYSSKTIDGECYLTKEDFITAISPDEDYANLKREHYGILFNLADTRKRGLLSFTDFVVFEDLLAKPDAEYIIAFKLFDLDNSGKVSVDEFKSVLSQNWDPDSVPFDFESDWLKMYTGGKGPQHEIQFNSFCQLLKGLQAERIRQSFKYFDKNNDGIIAPHEFKTIVQQISKHKLSDYVIEHSPTLANVFAGSNISYANVIAFHNVIRQLDLVESIVDQCLKQSKTGSLTRADFMNTSAQSARFTLFTPMEVDIIFHFAGLNNTSGRLTRGDFDRLFDPTWKPAASNSFVEATKKEKSSSVLSEAINSAYSFILGSIAGAVGATVVYPIDLVKTRMQNQRSAVVGQVMYKNSIDCFQKVIKNEGILGLYRGLGPQLIGVAPEKAIKLTMNDLVRNIFTDKTNGTIPLWAEILAGSCAGGSQVVFTNPLEIVKIRLQVQGELSKSMNGPPKQSAIQIVRQLGLFGLYKGVGACLLRDVPFSAIYFSAYSHIKKDYFNESAGKKLKISELLIAGAVAGMPAAYLTTPADVIKTRLQVEARKGETTYKGITDAARKILKEEGFSAFFKGGPARIFRSSPQFGVTLAVYEVLQRSFPLSKAEDKVNKVVSHVIAPQTTADLQSLKSRQALKLLLSLDYKFGLVAPKTRT